MRGPTIVRRRAVSYPYQDDQPLWDCDANAERMTRTASALKRAMHLRGVVAYVSSNILVYPVEGHPRIRSSPDILVAPGCEQYDRLNFKCWEEPGRIEFAGEFLQFTHAEHLEHPKVHRKVRFYRDRLATRELFLYEPLGFTSAEGFQFRFLRLSPEGDYVPVKPFTAGWYHSLTLSLLIRPAPLQVDLLDPLTGERYLSAEERAETERARAETETARADAAEAEVARLRALLEQRERRAGPALPS